ncbi:MAG: ABC transporter permease [Eubacteriales bacterium]|jgi:simple sugar transport system permease protein|nr:ABC transporter permease [Eubacteriales bacterium]
MRKIKAVHHEPFVRMSKRDGVPLWKSLGIRLIGLTLALIVCAVIIYALTQLNPLRVYVAMFKGAFGTNKRIWVTIRDIVMLLCIAVGLAPAFKMRFWNIGAEGQVLVGGIASAACMIYLGKTMPTLPLLVIMFVLSLIAGGIWGTIPAVFKARWNANETLFTLMMNYIAIQLTSFFVAKWENPFGSNTVGIINTTSKAGWFPPVFGQMYTLNVIIVLIVAVLMYLYLRYSKQGYEIAVVGESENTARYAAINVKGVVIRTMAISGAICGIAGFIAVAGASHTISTSTAGGQGFTAIIVAWLARFNTFIMIAISTLLVFLEKGAVEIASQFDLNDFVSEMITGIILFFILGSEFFINYKVRFRVGKKGAGK